nr:uncharacterized protein LOC129450442 [Misgurnus anguillicaudatus]
MIIKECGQGIVKYLMTKAKNKPVISEGEDAELTLIRLLMAYFDEKTEGLILRADMSATAADVEQTLTLPASPRLILLVAGDEITLGGWMISIENNIICEGIQQSFIRGLAAVFATYYVFNLQYQEEAARTLEFVQRRLIGVNPERGTKASQVKLSKKTGKLVTKKAATVNPHVATLIKNLMDFEWGFIFFIVILFEGDDTALCSATRTVLCSATRCLRKVTGLCSATRCLRKVTGLCSATRCLRKLKTLCSATRCLRKVTALCSATRCLRKVTALYSATRCLRKVKTLCSATRCSCAVTVYFEML